jgi:Flp pilus assembly protein TadG
MNQAPCAADGVLISRLRSDRGQATVEFALIVLFLFAIVLSVLEMVMFMHTYSVLADSAKEGVRYAIVHGANNAQASGPTCPCADIDGPPAPAGTVAGYGSGYGVVKSFARYSLHDTSGMTVTVTYGPADTPAVTPLNKTPNRVQVVVAYPYQPIFGLSWPTVTVNAAAEGRIMN